MPGLRESRSRNAVLMVAAAALVVSCTARRPSVDKLTEDDVEKLNHGAGGRLTEDIDKQTISPEREAEMRAKRGPATLQPGEPIWLQTGKSRVVQLPNSIKRVSIGNPDLAGVVVLGPRTIMLNAKKLPRAMGQTGSGSRTGTRTVVSGKTLTPEPRFEETTFAIWSGTDTSPDVHTLFVADFVNQQIMLEVTVAEINRTAAEQHGIDFRAAKESFVAAYFMGGGAGPAASGAASLIPGGTALLPIGTTDLAPVFAFHLPNDDITGFIQAMQQEGLATILAQPKLVAMSGQNAVFQVGGEIPIRIATGFATDVEFKPFGTIVNFVPRISEEGDIILTVTPEVSQPDFSSPVEGIPSFRVRRASTATRLRNGQTLVIGGLMQTVMRETVSGIPYLKDIPLIGYIFRKSNYSDEVTELVVIVTPRLVAPMPPDTQLALPTDRGPMTNWEIRTQPEPAEASRPRIPGLP